jgi:hypothetical protein
MIVILIAKKEPLLDENKVIYRDMFNLCAGANKDKSYENGNK